jgi:dTDP-4-dehydrorhamnose 3,5-epimerase
MIFRETALRGACVIELEPHTDDRGQFVRTWCREEFASHGLDAEFAQSSFSINPERGTVRGLHWHERGQDDLFFCPQGRARVVVLDRREDSPTNGVAWSVDIDGDNCLAVYIPGRVAHGFEALTDVVLCYHVTEEYDPSDPDEQNVRWDDERVRGLWSTTNPTLSSRDA